MSYRPTHTHIDICVCKHTHIHRNPCYRSIPAHVCQQHHEHVSYHSLVDWYGMDKWAGPCGWALQKKAQVRINFFRRIANHPFGSKIGLAKPSLWNWYDCTSCEFLRRVLSSPVESTSNLPKGSIALVSFCPSWCSSFKVQIIRYARNRKWQKSYKELLAHCWLSSWSFRTRVCFATLFGGQMVTRRTSLLLHMLMQSLTMRVCVVQRTLTTTCSWTKTWPFIPEPQCLVILYFQERLLTWSTQLVCAYHGWNPKPWTPNLSPSRQQTERACTACLGLSQRTSSTATPQALNPTPLNPKPRKIPASSYQLLRQAQLWVLQPLNSKPLNP